MGYVRGFGFLAISQIILGSAAYSVICLFAADPDDSALLPSCPCSSVCQDTHCLAPSPSAQVLVDASLPPARTSPDHSALKLGCSCSSVWKVMSWRFAVFCNLEADLFVFVVVGRGLGGEGNGIVGWIDGASWETRP